MARQKAHFMLKNICLNGNSRVSQLTNVDDKHLYLFGDNGIDGIEPWISDGTPEGTLMLMDVNPFGNSLSDEKVFYPRHFVRAQD